MFPCRALCWSLLTGLFFVSTHIHAADRKDALWEKLKPFFAPPAEYRDDYGRYRSPLLFADGTKVQSAADWQRRRQEILNEWHRMLGPWPDLLKQPKIKVLATERRENFTQHR